MTDNRPTSCADSFEKDAISVNPAKQRIFDEITPIDGQQKMALRDALNRFLAEDIFSPTDVPPHRNSAMDGYALAGDDLPSEDKEDKIYEIIGTSFAGYSVDINYRPGSLIKIMTGAVMPAGTDTVVMQEQAETIGDNQIRLLAEHRHGQNVRHPGEDIAKGSKVLAKGNQIKAADLGVLASLGFAEIPVYRKPRVAFFSTGDELRSIGDTLDEGEIFDSNRYTLFGMLQNMGVDIIDMGVIEDTPDAIRSAFKSASENADIFISSGGVSVGEADFIKPTLHELGEQYFWKLAMKPGRPLTFGKVNNAWFFGLPGNPVAVMVTFLNFVQPAIHYLASGQKPEKLVLQASSEEAIRKRLGRTEFIRGVFTQKIDHDLMSLSVRRTGKQGSGILSSMSLANCFIHLPETCEGVEVGDTIEILPFL